MTYERYRVRLSGAVEGTKRKLEIDRPIKIGVILGTGWGDSLELENKKEILLARLLGHELMEIKGHVRKLEFGQCNGKDVLVLRGRVHLNEEPTGDSIPLLVRLQTELMIKLGVKNLIVTAGVGSLVPSIMIGHVVVVDGFISLFAPSMPLWGGEFHSPDDTLDVELQSMAINMAKDVGLVPNPVGYGGYAMVRGPFFEGCRYDKGILERAGASVVGMSMLPEACIAALYDTKVLGLGFVTNNRWEKHTHEGNLRHAQESSGKLSEYLKRIIDSIA